MLFCTDVLGDEEGGLIEVVGCTWSSIFGRPIKVLVILSSLNKYNVRWPLWSRFPLSVIVGIDGQMKKSALRVFRQLPGGSLWWSVNRRNLWTM